MCCRWRRDDAKRLTLQSVVTTHEAVSGVPETTGGTSRKSRGKKKSVKTNHLEFFTETEREREKGREVSDGRAEFV